MAHYAFVNSSNIVTQVIVGRDEDDLPEGITSWEQYYGERMGERCLRTSYNTFGNQHKAGGEPFRGNYAGVGFKYLENEDVFVAPQPFTSWSLNENYLWEAPTPYPTDGEDYVWNENRKEWELVWDEQTGNWVEVTNETE